jgi:ParB family chromosome partitioning protein
MGKIGKKLSSILSKDKGRSKGLYGLQPGREEPIKEVPVKGTSQGVERVEINDLKPNSLQPRKGFEEEKLKDLASSIKEKGVIQPIVYRNTNKGKEIIAGERRWRAAKLAKLDAIPAIPRDVSDEEALELAIIENIQRDDLNPIEKAVGFKTLIDSYSLTQEKVAENLGISRSAVANFMRLLQLPPQVKEFVSRETLSMGHARCLLSLPNQEQQIALAKKIVKQGLSVRQVEEYVYGEKEG